MAVLAVHFVMSIDLGNPKMNSSSLLNTISTDSRLPVDWCTRKRCHEL